MKKSLLTIFAAIVMVFATLSSAQAQQNRIHASWSDGYYLTLTNAIMSIVGGSIAGDNLLDMTTTGGITAGYTYLTDNGRWALGGEASVWSVTEKWEKKGKDTFTIFSIMPTAQCYYIKSGTFRLYGSASAGVGIAPDTVGFAWQFNPIAVRIGSDKFAGFLEVGAGMKGIFTAGLQIGF